MAQSHLISPDMSTNALRKRRESLKTAEKAAGTAVGVSAGELAALPNKRSVYLKMFFASFLAIVAFLLYNLKELETRYFPS